MYSADHILVAVGGYPTIPDDVPGAEHGISSDGFFELTSLPKKSVVVGAGYIAVEIAGILKSLGSDVTLIIRGEKVLRTFDPMISDILTEELEHMGVNVLKTSNVSNVEEKSKGVLTISTKQGTSLTLQFISVLRICPLYSLNRSRRLTFNGSDLQNRFRSNRLLEPILTGLLSGVYCNKAQLITNVLFSKSFAVFTFLTDFAI